MRRVAVLLFAVTAGMPAQRNNFLGAYGGISTLSADGSTKASGAGVNYSGYKPENGPTAVVFGGRHIIDWVSLMGSYGWNRNQVLMHSGSSITPQAYYEQPRTVTMHTWIGEVLIYFRDRRSRIRPYLSGGFGVTRTVTGEAVAPRDTLTVDILDTRTDRVAWHAWTTRGMGPGITPGEKTTALLRDAIAQILRPFPPR